MNERQYDQVLRNRPRYRLRLLFAGPEAGRLLKALDRSTADFRAAAEAWACVRPLEVQAESRVVSFERGCLRVAVANSTALHVLRSRSAVLLKRLSALLPGVRTLYLFCDPKSGA